MSGTGTGEVVFWIAAVVPGAFTFVLNLLIRGKNMLRTFGADWLLLIVAFDISCLIVSADAKRHVQSDYVREIFNPLVMTSMVITLLLWIVVVKTLEASSLKAVLPAATLAGVRSDRVVHVIDVSAKQVFFSGLGWAITMAVTAFHVYMFLMPGGVE